VIEVRFVKAALLMYSEKGGASGREGGHKEKHLSLKKKKELKSFRSAGATISLPHSLGGKGPGKSQGRHPMIEKESTQRTYQL